MGNHSDGSPNHSGTVATAGQNEVEKFRILDFLRTVCAWLTRTRRPPNAPAAGAALFALSVLGTVIFLAAYFAITFPITQRAPRSGCTIPSSGRPGPRHVRHRHRHGALGQGPHAGHEVELRHDAAARRMTARPRSYLPPDIRRRRASTAAP